MKQEPKSQDPKHQEIKLEETKKPGNLRANALLCLVSRWKIEGAIRAAMTAASKLKQSYPVIQVAVYDAITRTFASVQTQPPEI